METHHQPGRYFYYWKFRFLDFDPGRKSSLPPSKYKKRSISQTFFRLFEVCPVVCRILFMSRRRIFFFNHTSRVRKSAEGITSLYLRNILPKCSHSLVIEERSSATNFNGATQVIEAEWIEAWVTLATKLLRPKDPDFFAFRARETIWWCIFRWCKPKYVVVLVWYGKMWAIAAAKRAGVRVIELQHGVIYPEHAYYKFDVEGGSEGEMLVPDEIWAYGEYWRGLLTTNGFPANRTRVVGYYVDDMQKSKVEFPYVVYISNGDIPKALYELLRLYKAEFVARGWKLVIAPHPHPVENVEANFSHLLDDIVRILPLDSYDLLRGAEAVLSPGSTMLWECIRQRKPGFLVEVTYDRPAIWDRLVDTGFVRRLRLDEFPEPFPLPPADVSETYFAPFRTWPETE